MVQAVMMNWSAVMTNISVTLASESEAPACLALIPKAASARVELLIARADGEFAGAGAVFWANALEPPGFHALVRVLSGARRRGVGRKLIEASVALTDAETDGLWSFDAVPHDSGEAKFLEACGFKALRREYHYQVVQRGHPRRFERHRRSSAPARAYPRAGRNQIPVGAGSAARGDRMAGVARAQQQSCQQLS